MSIRGLPDNIAEVVRLKYDAAHSAGALTFAHTEVATVDVSGATYQIRFSPSLSAKPEARAKESKAPHSSRSRTQKDPFTDVDPELQVALISCSDASAFPTHILVLNKYPIIPNHLILATYHDAPQTQPLEHDDIWATHSLVRAWREDATSRASDDSLFAFFNSGPASGASQPHRHVQFLPVSGMRDPSCPSWQPLVNNLATLLHSSNLSNETNASCSSDSTPYPTHILRNPQFPCLAFAAALPAEPSPKQLHATYMALLNLAISIAVNKAFSPELDVTHDVVTSSPAVTTGNEVPISYNMAMTTDIIVLLPRNEGKAAVRGANGDVMEMVGINGTILAGTVLCKSREGFEALTSGEFVQEKVKSLVEGVGIGIAEEARDEGMVGRL